jgi:hypothetical protein
LPAEWIIDTQDPEVAVPDGATWSFKVTRTGEVGDERVINRICRTRCIELDTVNLAVGAFPDRIAF